MDLKKLNFLLIFIFKNQTQGKLMSDIELLKAIYIAGIKMRDSQVNLDKYPRIEAIKREREFDKVLEQIKIIKHGK